MIGRSDADGGCWAGAPYAAPDKPTAPRQANAPLLARPTSVLTLMLFSSVVARFSLVAVTPRHGNDERGLVGFARTCRTYRRSRRTAHPQTPVRNGVRPFPSPLRHSAFPSHLWLVPAPAKRQRKNKHPGDSVVRLFRVMNLDVRKDRHERVVRNRQVVRDKKSHRPGVDSGGRCNGLGERLTWCHEAQGLSRSRVE